MPNTRKILVVDDDLEFRDALTEQLGLHEEFYMSRALSSPISRPPLHFRPFFCST